MDFLRRMLGLPSNSSAEVSPSENEVVITYNDDDSASPALPPEPVIQAPEPGTVETPPGAFLRVDDGNAVDQTTPLEEPDGSVGTRPLPPLETIVPRPGHRMVLGQLSDVGMVRGNNQDAMFGLVSSGTSTDDLPDFGLFIVADGMGGHQEGERASAITTRIVAKHVLHEIYTPLLKKQMNDPDRPPIADVLRAAVQEANESVTEEIPEGGTTVTATVVLGDLAYIAHVGDSRAYVLTDDRIEQVTRDHSLVQRLIELDQLTPEEAAEHPQRNVLYRAIGQSESLDVDAITRRLPPRSRLLLCSDGLWNMVAETTLQEMVSKHSDPQEACNQLIRVANERGGPDNITVILVQMPG